MNRIPRARYTKEVWEEAVNLARAVGVSEASRRLSIPLKTLANWMRAANAGKLQEVGKQQPATSEAELELMHLKRELAEVKMERDLLKKPLKSVRFIHEVETPGLTTLQRPRERPSNFWRSYPVKKHGPGTLADSALVTLQSEPG